MEGFIYFFLIRYQSKPESGKCRILIKIINVNADEISRKYIKIMLILWGQLHVNSNKGKRYRKEN